MTDVLKELVEFTEKYPMRPEHYEALRDHEQSRALDTLKLLKVAIPALKALLSHEAVPVSELREQLSAERARREKAEELVDAVIKGTGPWGSVYSLAEEYRTQYPRVEKEGE